MYRRRYSHPSPQPAEDLLVFPSPNASLSDISESSEFTLLEGSALSELSQWSGIESDSEVSNVIASRVPSSPLVDLQSYPRRPIPLLAFLSSLLAVDPATLHLLDHPPVHSPLFPGPPLAPDPPEDTLDTQHGLFRLLGHRSRRLHDGTAVALEQPSNPFTLVAPFQIVRACVQALASVYPRPPLAVV